MKGGNEACSACGTASPCEEQGICLDPTVFRIARPGARSDSASASAGPDGLEAFLIEGQLVVRAPDGCWVPAIVPVDTSRAAKDQGVVLTDAQVTALGLPADPGEARASLMRAQADAVRHGDHLDFVVNGRLLHIVDDAVSDCGKSCPCTRVVEIVTDAHGWMPHGVSVHTCPFPLVSCDECFCITNSSGTAGVILEDSCSRSQMRQEQH